VEEYGAFVDERTAPRDVSGDAPADDVETGEDFHAVHMSLLELLCGDALAPVPCEYALCAKRIRLSMTSLLLSWRSKLARHQFLSGTDKPSTRQARLYYVASHGRVVMVPVSVAASENLPQYSPLAFISVRVRQSESSPWITTVAYRGNKAHGLELCQEEILVLTRRPLHSTLHKKASLVRLR
jgi:hypothetical protein